LEVAFHQRIGSAGQWPAGVESKAEGNEAPMDPGGRTGDGQRLGVWCSVGGMSLYARARRAPRNSPCRLVIRRLVRRAPPRAPAFVHPFPLPGYTRAISIDHRSRTAWTRWLVRCSTRQAAVAVYYSLCVLICHRPYRRLLKNKQTNRL
jgi:hypothetical protein